MTSKKFKLSDIKKKRKSEINEVKKEKFVNLAEALKPVLGMPGLPLGRTTQLYGRSDTGKTTLAFHAAAECQKQGILPIFIITEGKVSWDRARSMGLQYTGDLPEDQRNEEELCIVEYAEYLEDVFKVIIDYLNMHSNGDLPLDIMFFVDSIGNSISKDSIKLNKKTGELELGGAMMKASRVIRENMRVIQHRIDDTRKLISPKYAGLVFINHAYDKPPAFPGGPTTLKYYGGEGIYYSSSLVLKFSKSKKLSATKDSKSIQFGIVSKIIVEKNHVTNSSNTGEFVITADAIIPNDKAAIDDYKNANKDQWGSVAILNEDGELLSE